MKLSQENKKILRLQTPRISVVSVHTEHCKC